MPRMQPTTRILPARKVRAKFGSILQGAAERHEQTVVERRGEPAAVIVGIRDYVRMAAPEPEVLRLIGELSVRNGTDRLTDDEIDAEIQAVRREKRARA